MAEELWQGSDGLRIFLDRATVLQATIEQLHKDLSLVDDRISAPPVGEEVFERLRTQVLPVLDELQRKGTHALKVAMYRVDIPETHMRKTMAAGGLDALAGETVLRCLQKVLTRARFAGRF